MPPPGEGCRACPRRLLAGSAFFLIDAAGGELKQFSARLAPRIRENHRFLLEGSASSAPG